MSVAKPLPGIQSMSMWIAAKAFYMPASGQITAKYSAALADHGLQPVMGQNARLQPGNLSEVLLHETAVSWLRVRLAESVPAKAWAETPEEFASRLRACCQAVNSAYDVDGLCRAFPARIAKLRAAGGGRLKE